MKVSIAPRVVLLLVVLLLCASLLALGMGNTTVPRFTTSSTMTEPPTSTTMSTTSTEPAGAIAFSNPEAYETLAPNQNLTISGAVSPEPTTPDSILIEVTQQGSLTVLHEGTVAVQSAGTFSYSTSVGPTWPSGTYVITATDSSGATGTEMFIVTYGDIWCC